MNTECIYCGAGSYIRAYHADWCAEMKDWLTNEPPEAPAWVHATWDSTRVPARQLTLLG